MKPSLVKFILLFISVTSIYGMCSKQDDTGNGGGGSLPDTVLNNNATWVYFEACPTLIGFYNNNDRSTYKKWVATKIISATVNKNTTTGNYFFGWNFENTGNTRFLPDAFNPRGEESMGVYLSVFPSNPVTGSYIIQGNDGACSYNVYSSSGAKHDSTRVQDPTSGSTFIITDMKYFATDPVENIYKMSGIATFHIFNFPNGATSTTDIHTLQCHFNNVIVNFVK